MTVLKELQGLPEGSFIIRWDGYHGYRVSVPGLERATVVPADAYRKAAGIIETARQELRDAIDGGNPQVLREYAEDAVEAMSAFLANVEAKS